MSKPFPLLPTVGTIPANQIVGRDKDIISLLRLLRSQSVSLEEMRRMGKTLLLLKLTYLCNKNLLPPELKREKFKARYFSFQGKQNFGEVIDALHKELKDFKEWYQIDFTKTYNYIKSAFSIPEIEIGGAKFSLNLPEYKKSWKEIFNKTLEDIAEAQAKTDGKLILIFDELPIMLWEWYKEGKHEDAMELLDMLRERRQMLETKGIRFIYCGSIGIKVVLNTFRTDFKYTGEPTNEMAEFSLKPFSKEESDFLCECFLLSDFKLTNEEKPVCLKLVHDLSNGLPFYISQIFNLLQTEFDYEITEGNIQAAYGLILTDPKYHKAFKQLMDRIEIYYSATKRAEMIKILNEVSRLDDFISEEELFTRLDIPDENAFNESLYILLSDHYLTREFRGEQRFYKFRYQLFKKWWRINKA